MDLPAHRPQGEALAGASGGWADDSVRCAGACAYTNPNWLAAHCALALPAKVFKPRETVPVPG